MPQKPKHLPTFSRPQETPSLLLEKLTPRRREIIRPALESPREFVLISIRDAAHRLQTDATSIVRIVQQMGFPGYRAFQNYLQDLTISTATSLDGMRQGQDQDDGSPTYLTDCISQTVKNIDTLIATLDRDKILRVAQRICGARQILLIGGDFAANLVSYLEYQMVQIGLPAVTAPTAGLTAHRSRNVTEKDTVIALSFRRGLRQTVDGLVEAREKGAYCIGVTDTYISPIARFSDEVFIASIESGSFSASYVAPLALLNVLVVACANVDRDKTMRLLKEAAQEERHGHRWYS